jgi:N-methylhydantoinase B
MAQVTRAIDPITSEIIRNFFISCAQDMNATLIRSAYTPIIYEGKDCSVALLDENGEVLGQSSGLPLFLGNLEICVKLTMQIFGRQVFEPGDVYYMNDPYMQGTHLNDATIFAPIFWNERLVGFAATRAHWLDVGAKDPGGPMDSVNIYQEGFRFGPTKICSRYTMREDIVDILRRNGRFGYSLVGDMNAQIAACRKGEERFQAIIDRFGLETIWAARDEIFRQSGQLDREAIAAIPDGTYTAEGFLDNDGVGTEPVMVRVRVDVLDDQMTIDLAGSSPATIGPVNCGIAQTISAARVAYKLLINPERPVDGGTFPTLTVTAPEGTLFYAQEPAACQWYFTPLGLLIDLIVKALSSAMPEKVAGAHYGDSMVIYLAGLDPRKGNTPFLSVEANPGGWGAFSTGDGQDGLINNVNGGFKDMPVEVFESKYPVQIRRYGFRPDSGGAGKFRGGCGLYREYHLEADCGLYLWFERSKTPAWGLFGGQSATGPENIIDAKSSGKILTPLKANNIALKAGDVVTIHTGGGGGFGHPWERDPELVRHDVLNGYVTREGAERDYGVVFTDHRLEVDIEKTRHRRAELAGSE